MVRCDASMTESGGAKKSFWPYQSNFIAIGSRMRIIGSEKKSRVDAIASLLAFDNYDNADRCDQINETRSVVARLNSQPLATNQKYLLPVRRHHRASSLASEVRVRNTTIL